MKLPYFGLLGFCIILGICHVQGKSGKPEKKYCRAAVYELKQYNDETSSEKELISKNFEKYSVAASLAASNNVDILVFPEKGLFPMIKGKPAWFLKHAEDIPPGSKNVNPCNDVTFSNRPILRNLSCIAQKHNFFVVATLFDVKQCEVKSNCESSRNKNICVTDKSECPDSGYFYFNTLVAFNGNGTLLVRYYKRHPFPPLEKGITTPKYPEPAFFSDESCSYATDIGLDFLFVDPVNDLKKVPKTSAITYGNWWFDHTPFSYFSVPNQQAFCLTNKVNVLSSDVHAPNLGSLGSGIYIPNKGAVVYSYNPDGKSKLLISNIPVSNSSSNLDEISLDTRFFYIEDDDTIKELNGEEPSVFKEECGENVLGKNTSSLTDYRCKQTEVEQYTFVKLNKTQDSFNICSNDFCCSLEYQAKSMNETFYFGVSGKRLNFYDIHYFGVQSCILARCEPVLGKPCRNFLLRSNTEFQSVTITGSFDTNHIYPHILNSGLRLTDRDEWSFDGKSQMVYQNLRGKNLLYADLYGRLYERDEPINNSNSLPSFI